MAPSPSALFGGGKPATARGLAGQGHAGAVYRSLAVANPVAGGGGQDALVDAFASMSVKKQAAAATQAAPRGLASGGDARVIPRLPLPLELFPLAKSHHWLPDANAEDVVQNIEAALKQGMGENATISLKRSSSKCCFECCALGAEMGESVNFAVNVFDAQGEDKAGGRFLVEAERTAGDPFLFHHVMKSTMGGATKGAMHFTPSAMVAQQRPFQAPVLPADIDASCLCGKGSACMCDMADIKAVLNTAVSNVHEQRVQALCAIAEHCIKDKTFCKKLCSIDGAMTRLKPLQTDPNPLVQRATQRIIASCGTAAQS